ncbi:hypothetical protein PENTCL1PPCAC_4489, partial [Pristionchus entomophagus]
MFQIWSNRNFYISVVAVTLSSLPIPIIFEELMNKHIRSKMRLDTVIFLGHGIPGSVIYLGTLYTLWTLRKQLRRSFLVILFVSAAINFLTNYNSWTIFRLVKEPSFAAYYRFSNEMISASSATR